MGHTHRLYLESTASAGEQEAKLATTGKTQCVSWMMLRLWHKDTQDAHTHSLFMVQKRKTKPEHYETSLCLSTYRWLYQALFSLASQRASHCIFSNNWWHSCSFKCTNGWQVMHGMCVVDSNSWWCNCMVCVVCTTMEILQSIVQGQRMLDNVFCIAEEGVTRHSPSRVQVLLICVCVAQSNQCVCNCTVKRMVGDH